MTINPPASIYTTTLMTNSRKTCMVVNSGTVWGTHRIMRIFKPYTDALVPDYPIPANVKVGVSYDYGELIGIMSSGGNSCF